MTIESLKAKCGELLNKIEYEGECSQEDIALPIVEILYKLGGNNE